MELVFNAWFIVDIGTGFSKYFILKPYCLGGNDDDKLKILHKLAETDYITSERIDFAENCTVQFKNLKLENFFVSSLINKYFDSNIDFFLNEMEKKLPPILRFKGDYLGENKVTEQKFSDNPLFVQTFLMENEYGEIRPYTTTENKEWYYYEKTRIDNKSKGMQN